MFVPVAIETTGVFGPNAQSFLRELGHRLSVATGEQRSYSFLLQRLAVAVLLQLVGHMYQVMFSISVFVCCFYMHINTNKQTNKKRYLVLYNYFLCTKNWTVVAMA